MKLVVFSDVHGETHRVEQLLAQQSTANAVIFLGDGLRGVEDVVRRSCSAPFYAVPGNCDFGASLPACREETFGGKRVFFTHGHTHQVKYGLDRLMYAAEERKAHIALFGHTHQACAFYEDGIYYLNPGSLGYDRTYGVVEILPGGILTNIATLPY